MEETIRATEVAAVDAQQELHEPIQWRCHWKLDKRYGDWSGDDIDAGRAPEPYETLEGDGNLLVTNGANLLWNGLIGTAITAFSNANARIGVGDGGGTVPTPAIGDTDLTAATNKVRVAMDATYPTVATNVVTFRSTFAAGTGTFVWNEWGVFNAATGATSMLNHKGESLGTKSAGASWTLTITISLA